MSDRVLVVTGSARRSAQPLDLREYMPTFLFIFGYEDSIDAAANDRLGTDGESSTGVFIEVENEAAALLWGQEIAEHFLKFDWQNPDVSWRSRRYAFEVEHDADSSSWRHCLAFFPKVRVGQFPDFSKMTTKAYVDWCKQHGLHDA